MSKRVMPWLELLPQFRLTGYPQRRDEIEGLIAEADWLKRRADELRSKAYVAALRLEGDVKARWSDQAVDEAKRRAEQSATRLVASLAEAKR